MRHEAFKAATKAAREFLARADAVKWTEIKAAKPFYSAHDGKANAAMKRASLDLTRALADMRRP